MWAHCLRPPKSHTFRGRRYRIEIGDAGRDADGYCEPPTAPEKMIVVQNRRSVKRYMETCIHEALHACLWDLSENAVAETAEDITTFTIRMLRAKGIDL